MPRVVLTTEINASKEIVFDISRSIDLHKISTEQTNEEAIAGVTTGLIGLNEWVTWQAKHFGISQKLTTKITEFEYPNYFTDEMMKGAFKNFKHKHVFESRQNGTLMTDYFDYTSPLGFLGKIADSLFLKKYMTNFLKKRNTTIKAFAESEKWKQLIEINK
ncbi:Ligand-binding SRPBCC domain-containing protein [Maribacter dokdonensis]|uniref:Ligand-binding SRPBCC domain-containing protein n=1 Tax=Maribacter dokdonensis TaxID=320912 RepID=A0ABY0UNT9_9FLAO|nr:SRPBCC family protein [Maribacter dokdonensis]SDS96846.1 Ligand-binding SRPBCC domain-containing protein [Maribacter dokdonensis]